MSLSKPQQKIFKSEADHVWSAHPNDTAFPPETVPEVAFVGRSNVGKSSLINAVLNRKKLARTSKTPGATRALHFYDVAGVFNLVDLPGYGYAKLSKTEVKKIGELMRTYFEGRRTLKAVFMLIDGRHGLKEVDREFMNSLIMAGVPVHMVLTKMDKARGKAGLAVQKQMEEALATTAGVSPDVLPTSSEKRVGLDALQEAIVTVCGL